MRNFREFYLCVVRCILWGQDETTYSEREHGKRAAN